MRSRVRSAPWPGASGPTCMKSKPCASPATIRRHVATGHAELPVLATTMRATAAKPPAAPSTAGTMTRPKQKAPETPGKPSKATAHCLVTSPRKPSHSASNWLPRCRGAPARSCAAGRSIDIAASASASSAAASTATSLGVRDSSWHSTKNHWLSSVASESKSSARTSSKPMDSKLQESQEDVIDSGVAPAMGLPLPVRPQVNRGRRGRLVRA
mmetsp:Transcript_125461/g.349176  ORF Transcript_125461/g.349176 Transcript_125461/m.349176 type:complete len:213 (+) Transcript_125461:276-914(+)